MRSTRPLPRSGPSGIGGELVAAGDAVDAIEAVACGGVVPAGRPDEQGGDGNHAEQGPAFGAWGHAGQSTAFGRGRNAMRTGSASHLVVYAVTGVGGLALAAVSPEPMTQTPPLIFDALVALAAVVLGWLGLQIVGTRDAVRRVVDPETGVFVRLDHIEHEMRRVVHHVGLPPQD